MGSTVATAMVSWLPGCRFHMDLTVLQVDPLWIYFNSTPFKQKNKMRNFSVCTAQLLLAKLHRAHRTVGREFSRKWIALFPAKATLAVQIMTASQSQAVSVLQPVRSLSSTGPISRATPSSPQVLHLHDMQLWWPLAVPSFESAFLCQLLCISRPCVLKNMSQTYLSF